MSEFQKMIFNIRKLTRRTIRLKFGDKATEIRFQNSLRRNSRTLNRTILCLMVAIFDSFFLPEIGQAPEIVRLSLVLRFLVLTPAIVLFVVMDWADRLSRVYGPAICILCILPTALVSVEILGTTSAAALPNIQAAPLILLVAIGVRLTVPQVIVIVLFSWLFYIGAISTTPVVPPLFLPSMILTSLALGLGAVAFTLRIDGRERAVFLLQLRAESRNQRLTQLAGSDALTGVANRRSFDEGLERLWKEAFAQHRPLALIMIDVDHFKQFNDHYGHRAGDLCLQKVANAVQDCVRSGDIVARYGGEEFAVIVPEASPPRALTVAERILDGVRALRLRHDGLGADRIVTVSLGVASLIPRDADGMPSLVELADHFLYAAKNEGRNRLKAGTAASV
jgi:diguanylate cyclase (GGDEF)-like protein